MAFPTVQSITNTDFATAATDHNVSMPATVNSGDLLLMGFSYAHGADNDTPTTPTGWSSVITTGNSFSGEGRLTVYVKNANGSEGGGTVNVVTPTSHRAAATVYRITGWRNSGTILNDVEGAAVVSDGSNQSASTPGPPNLNPANWDVEDTLWIAFAAGFPGSGDVASYTSGPTGYGNFSSHGSGSGDDHALLATARKENAAASEDPSTFEADDAITHVTATLAVRPAAASAAPKVRRLINGGNWSPLLNGGLIG